MLVSEIPEAYTYMYIYTQYSPSQKPPVHTLSHAKNYLVQVKIQYDHMVSLMFAQSRFDHGDNILNEYKHKS